MIKYYPSFRVKTDQKTTGNRLSLDGAPYSGDYYETYDNKFYSGPNPIVGPNEELKPFENYGNSEYLNASNLPSSVKNQFLRQTNVAKTQALEPVSYYPKPTVEDYTRGYFIRYFIKKINSKGFVIEISPEEYNEFVNGTVRYDVSFYLVTQIFWKITGDLNTKRYSQYDIRLGIIEVNKKNTEDAGKNFLGLIEFIGGEYAKFSRPTV
jgi:hypothetical protein